MKRSVRTLSLILALVLFALMAAGCGSEKSTGTPQFPFTTPAPASQAQQPATPQPALPATPAPPSVTVQERVLFDQDKIRITLKGYSEDDYSGPELKLLIENDTDQTICVMAEDCSVNGYMVGAYLTATVPAGKKSNERMSFYSAGLRLAGISTIADAEFRFHIVNDSTWDTICDSDKIRIETSAAPGFPYSYDDSGVRVFNQNGFDVVIKGLSQEDSWYGPELIFYFYNTSPMDVIAQVRDFSVNGYMVGTICSCTVTSGKRALDTISISAEDLAASGIDKIETIEFAFLIFDEYTYQDIVKTDPIILNFN